MASFIRSWIVSSIITHDERHGADLSPHLSNPVFCQLVKFTSFRTASQPTRQISAVVSDRTHKISVVFERHAADSSKAGENPELLTSSIRSTLRLTEYSISLLSQYPITAQLDSVRVQLVIHRWAVVTGDGNEPEYFPHTVEVGCGDTRADREVNRILRKWWLGDSQKSIPAEPVEEPSEMASNALPGPSREISKEVDAGTFKRLKRANQLVADLSAAGKALPAWLFTPPSEAQRVELDAIGVFGTDPFKPEPESLDSNRPTSHLESNGHSGSLTNGTQYLRTESPRAQPLDGQTQYLPESPTHESLHESAQVPPTSQSPNEPHAQPAIDTSPPLRTGRFETPSDSDDDDSDSIPIPIRFTARRTKPPRRQGFKPSPQVPRAWSQPTGETDEDDLSDYEKEQRRAQKRPVPCESQGVSEESVAKSQDSGSFNLSRFPQSAPLPSSPVPASGPHVSSWAPQISSSAPAHVLVPTTDESMRTDPGPEPEPEPEASPPIPAPELPTPSMPRKRPRNSGASNVDADDEASQERPRKQAKAEIVSPIKSSWEPTPGQRVPSTVARPRQVSVSVSEAVRQVLPRYRPDLTTFTVPGMSKEMVESVRAKAVEEKAARERGRRQSGR